MAQTKAKSAKPSKAPTKSTRKSSATKTRATGKTRSRPKRSAGSAGNSASQVASKARVPLLAGGAAIVGTIGGVALGATRSGGKVLGVQLPRSRRVSFRSKDLAMAAKNVSSFGENVGDLASELKRAREGLANADGKHDSPIEILLRGLTNRR